PFLPLLDFAGGMDGDAVADLEIEAPGHFTADEQTAVRDVKFAFDDSVGQDGDVGFQLRIDPAEPGAVHFRLAAACRFGFDQHLFQDEGRYGPDILVRRNQPHEVAVIPYGFSGLNDFDVGIEPEDFVTQLLVEPAHDADDNDEDCDPERDAEHGNQG